MDQTFAIRVRTQILFPSMAVVRSLWKYQYARQIAKLHQPHERRSQDAQQGPFKQPILPILLSSRYHRVNAHEGLIDFEYKINQYLDNSPQNPTEDQQPDQQPNNRTNAPLTNTGTKNDNRTGISVVEKDVQTGHHLQTYGKPVKTRFEDIAFRVVDNLEKHVQQRDQEERSRLVFIDSILNNASRQIDINKNAVVQTLLFWQEPNWWREQMHEMKHQQWWTNRTTLSDTQIVRRQDFRRLCRLLNHLVRDLICTNGASTPTEAVRLLLNMPSQHCKMLNKLYVEPPMASLWAAYLSTTFMHHKQQHGLNTKHAAAAAGQTTNNATSGSPINSMRSEHSFDTKICLDMCSSCDKKEIFEIMVSLSKKRHDPTPCECNYCSTLRNIANAWQYYDCGTNVWLRLEFNRRFYVKVSSLLAECITNEEEDEKRAEETKELDASSRRPGDQSVEPPADQSDEQPIPQPIRKPITKPIQPTTEPITEPITEPRTEPITEPITKPITTPIKQPREQPNTPANSERTKIIYLSYKNEFTDRVKFMTNFVNYYAFYENSERPVSRDDCHGALREKISIIFVFALVNWELIERARDNNAAFNSISLNQQSIFKSLDNTLYAIFSENSINRMSKEKHQKLLSVNAPYVNRGFGSLPNCGINAFTTTLRDV